MRIVRRLGHLPTQGRQSADTTTRTLASRANNEAWREAVATVRLIARLMKQSTVAGGLTVEIGVLRSRHKAKRNFKKRLDAARR